MAQAKRKRKVKSPIAKNPPFRIFITKPTTKNIGSDYINVHKKYKNSKFKFVRFCKQTVLASYQGKETLTKYQRCMFKNNFETVNDKHVAKKNEGANI